MTFFLGVTKTTISASMCSRLVQVDVDLRMTEMLISAVTPNYSFFAFDRRNFIDKLDTPVFVDVTFGVNEADISVIFLIKDLKCRCFCLFQRKLLRKGLILTCPVWVSEVISLRLEARTAEVFKRRRPAEDNSFRSVEIRLHAIFNN